MLRVFVLDAHSIYRRGLVACLETMDGVAVVGETDSVEAARADPSVVEADVLLVDHELPGGESFLRDVRATTDAKLIVCSSRADDAEVLSVIQSGAVGYLCKDTLTPESLDSGMRAVADGAGVMTPELLGSLLRNVTRISDELLEPRGLTLSPLTEREQQVLSLVAEGHATREVASRLCYSERTIKNVLHDVVTKLNARTRSQAVAQAIRDGLI